MGLKTIYGHDVKCISNCLVVSKEEGDRLLEKARETDKRLSKVYSWYVPIVDEEGLKSK